MDLIWVGILGLCAMFFLIFLRVPVAVSMILTSGVGIFYLSGSAVLEATIRSVVWEHAQSYGLVTIPMFVLMGEALHASGITHRLYGAFRSWIGHVRGGLAVATIGASGIFAAASGSSLATVGTMGVVASREMTDAGYSRPYAAGTIVAGGGLGILIPPSTLLIIYGTLTEESIGKLLIAGLLPGIMLVGLFALTAWLVVVWRPNMGPVSAKSTLTEKLRAVGDVIPTVLLFIIVMGGMFLGLFSPTEASAIGAVGAMVIGATLGSLNLRSLWGALLRTVRTTGFLFAILLASFVLNYFLAVTGVPYIIAERLGGLDVSPFVIFLFIILMYLLLGAVMDSLAMVVVTVPIIYPIVVALGFSNIWFGIIVVLLIEIALITPPIGMNCFVLAGVTDLKLGEIFKGAAIYLVPLVSAVFILYFFPQIALFLPDRM